MEHRHPLEKVTAHPRLFLNYPSKHVSVIRARRLRLFIREDWNEFPYDGWSLGRRREGVT